MTGPSRRFGGHGPNEPRLHRLRPRRASLARSLPGVRRVEHAVRGGARPRHHPDAAGDRPRGGAGRVGGRRGGRGSAPGDGHRRARPRAGRRHRSRLGGAPRRAARDRQIDADQHGARQPRGGWPPDAVRLGRRVHGAGAPACPAAGRECACGARARRDRPRTGARRARARASGGVRDRFGPDARRAGALEHARLGRAGARGCRAHRGGGQAARHRGGARRARHQGRDARRPASPRAPRRLRPAVRGRARAALSHRSRDQEPLRIHERGGRLRDAPGRPRRGP